MKSPAQFRGSMRAFSLVFLCAIALLTGCRSPFENGRAPENQAKLELTGNSVGSHVIIDHVLTFDVTGEARTQFQLQPGPHHVRIEKNGKTVVDRTVSLSSGQTLDLSVP